MDASSAASLPTSHIWVEETADCVALVEQAAHVADREQATAVPLAVLAGHHGHVVRPRGAVEADLLVGVDTGGHVRGSVVVPRLDEALAVALHVPEVDERDVVAEPPDSIGDWLLHEREVALAETDAVVLTGVHIEDALVVLDGVDETGDAPCRGDRRVVGMERQRHPGLLGDGNDAVEEVLEVLPEAIFGDVGGRGVVGTALAEPVVVGGLDGPPAVGHLGVPEDADGVLGPHPAVHRDVQSAHVTQEVTDRIDLLVAPLAAHEPVAAVGKSLLDAAEAIRRAVLESHPIVVRHTATADGYVAGAAVERAVLPLIREEHSRDDAEYHYFTRRPLEEAVYGMDAATNDVTRMLEDRDRHDEKLPLVLLLGAGSTAESLDGLGLLGVYGSERVVVDAAPADDEVAEEVDVLVNPAREGADARDLSVGALASTLSVAVNDDVRDDVSHLPAVSYWENCPQQYLDLAESHGFDADRVRELREAVALEAYYQSYQDKRELIADLLFDADEGLAGHVSEQFRIKLEDEIETAQANLERREVGAISAAVLDSDAYSHRFDFPPTGLLVDELHRRTREGDAFVTVALGMDELYLRATGDLDLRAVVESAAENAPAAGLAAAGIREGRIEFLTGARDEALEAVLDAAAEQF